MPRILPLIGVAIGGVLAINALSGARDLPSLLSGAQAFAEEAAKAGKADKPRKGRHDRRGRPSLRRQAASTATWPATSAPRPPLPPPTIKPQAVCAPTAAELAKEAGLSPAELQVLQNLGERRGQLDKREDDLSTQLALMAAAEAKVDAKLKALNGLKADVQGLLSQADGREASEVDRLVKVFEGMKPKDAAPRFVLLDDSVRLPIAAKMKERSLSAMIALMPPEDAKKLTESLAHRFAAAQTLAQNADGPGRPPPRRRHAAAPATAEAAARQGRAAQAGRAAKAAAEGAAGARPPRPAAQAAATPPAALRRPPPRPRRRPRPASGDGAAPGPAPALRRSAIASVVAARAGAGPRAHPCARRGGPRPPRGPGGDLLAGGVPRRPASPADRDGQVPDLLSFGRDGDPDIARLRTSPPRWIKTAEKRHVHGPAADRPHARRRRRRQGGLRRRRRLHQRIRQAAARPGAPLPPRPCAVAEPEPPRPNPVPAGGVIHMDARLANSQVLLRLRLGQSGGSGGVPARRRHLDRLRRRREPRRQPRAARPHPVQRAAGVQGRRLLGRAHRRGPRRAGVRHRRRHGLDDRRWAPATRASPALSGWPATRPAALRR